MSANKGLGIGDWGLGKEAALSPEEFAARLSPLFPQSPIPNPQSPLAVAVSGGADSMALALLAHGWAEGKMVALTVDHGLRKESAVEAKQVAAWMKQRGIAHHTLRWKHDALSGNMQLQARAARYRLLAGWCKKHGIATLLTAHHQGDQAETVLLRLKRGSHIAGLSAIRPAASTHGIRLLRPLLAVPKARLVATLEQLKQEWIEDPSNANPAYDRNRLRALLNTLPDAEKIRAQLAEAAARLGVLHVKQHAELEGFLRTHAGISPGRITLGAEALAHRELALQALGTLLRQAGGAPYPPRFAALERLYAQLTASRKARRTLAGCLIERTGALITIIPERA